jgi:hypothetical protein
VAANSSKDQATSPDSSYDLPSWPGALRTTAAASAKSLRGAVAIRPSPGSSSSIARARQTGHLREDFTDRDLPILLMANAGVVSAAGDAAPDAWQRLVAHMIRSYATPGAPIPPMPDAPAPAALYRAMVRLDRPS